MKVIARTELGSYVPVNPCMMQLAQCASTITSKIRGFFMTRSLSRLLTAMTCAASLSVYAAYAADESDTRRPPQGKPHAPPQAAIDACKGLTEKTTCQFNGRNNEAVNGTCALPPPNAESTELSCRPERRGKDDHADHADKTN